VRREILTRILTQGKGWHDPHNNGTYAVLDSSMKDKLVLQRTSGGSGQYTDKVNFVLERAGAGCMLHGCSESQVFSVADMSTNYCNLRMLYCGAADGCKPVTRDFSVTEEQVSHSFGAGTDKNACLAVRR